MRDNLQLNVVGLCGGYGKADVVQGISFTIEAGDVMCVLGPNGCGKSTLLKLLMRFLPKSSGDVICRGESVDNMNRMRLAQVFAYIPQSSHMSFPFTVLEVVAMARTRHIGLMGAPNAGDLDKAVESLEKLKIAKLSDYRFNELSGGQQQLVLIARALCQETCVTVMDEPSSSLDFANQKLINDAVLMLSREGKIVIITTHSPSQPFEIASRVLLMSEGRTYGFGLPDEVLTSESLEKVYDLPMEIISVTDRNKRERKVFVSL